MKLLRLLLRQSPGLVAVAVVCGALSGVAFGGLVALLNEAIAEGRASLDDLQAKFVAVAVVALAARVGSQALLVWLQQRALFELRRGLSRRILEASLRDVEVAGAHQLLGALMEGVMSVGSSLSLLPYLFVNVVIIVASLAYLASLSLGAFVGMLAFIGLGLLTYWVPAARAMRVLKRGRDVQIALYKHFGSLVGGVKELKLHRARRGAFLEGHLFATARELGRLQTRGQAMFALSSGWGFLLFFVFLGLLVFGYQRYAEVTTATLTGYALTTLYMQHPFQMVLDLMAPLAQGEFALQRIERLGLSLSAPPSPSPAGGAAAHATEPRRDFRRVELVEVTHAYEREGEKGERGRFTLGPIDLSLEPGEIVFLVGGNGSGKTTLAKLIAGLYGPERGEVRLDGQPVTDATRDDYRQLFSAVFSDFHVFDTLLGLAPAEREGRIKHYLSRLLLDSKVEVVGGVLSTTALSQGQRKRLALLTAYLEDRPICLFDEWAADQDPQFKETFYNELLPELKRRGKTVVGVTHDDRYFHLADRVVKLEHGRLVALSEETEVEAG
ncbi:MAG: cyclic peptide export ABC transporter [Polyangiaceae bacterium]|nr:cyclic peptide export ABC transporter [Polyangiaceae bacterium]